MDADSFNTLSLESTYVKTPTNRRDESNDAKESCLDPRTWKNFEDKRNKEFQTFAKVL